MRPRSAQSAGSLFAGTRRGGPLRQPAVGIALACAASLASLAGPACGTSAGNPYSLPVGSDDAGTGSFGARDATAAAPLDAQIQENHVAVTIVALGCAGDCKTVEVVVTGGDPPYSFLWSDGSKSQTRQVCATATTSYGVAVTDSGSTGEFPRPAETINRPLTASVLACPDGGTPLGMPTGTSTVVVPGSADVWLAGQPAGTMYPDGMGTGTGDTAPAQSPVEVPVAGGSTLTFSATGGTSYTGGFCTGSSPDGGCTVLLASQGAGHGLSNLTTPMNALLGVFLGPGAPGGTAPAALDASGANDFTTSAPLLNQVFFIGDGLTGTGTGTVQAPRCRPEPRGSRWAPPTGRARTTTTPGSST